MTPARVLVALMALALPFSSALGQDQTKPAKPTKPEQPAAAKPSKEKVEPYTLETCAAGGEKLDAKAVTRTHEDREFRFCSDACADKFAAGPDTYIKKVDEKIIEAQLPYYAADVCPVSGEKLGSMGEPVNYVYRNRLVRFCCDMCTEDFEKDPAKHLARLDQATIDKQLATYPLENCPITGKKLGSMGEPVNMVVGNRLVRLCCKGCDSKVRKEPLKVFAKLDEAAKTKGEKPAAPSR